MQRDALKLSDTLLGKTRPDTLASMHGLASVLSDQRKYEEARQMF
jgi:hypothetical protein